MASESSNLERVGRFELKRRLERSVMVDRYAAEEEGAKGVSVSVELLRTAWAAEPNLRELYLEEAAASVAVRHPNLVAHREVLKEGGLCGLVVDSPKGQPLTGLWDAMRSNSRSLRLHILCEVLRGLQFAHELQAETLGVNAPAHGDIGPQSIWLGEDGRVYLRRNGFGRTLCTLSEVLGQPAQDIGYVAPEILNGARGDIRADIYSIGVLLWEAVAERRRVFEEKSSEVVRRRLEGQEPALEALVPRAPGRLTTICRRALAFAPDERYPCVAEMREELEGFVEDVYGEDRAAQSAELLRLLQGSVAPLPSRVATTRKLPPPMKPTPPPVRRSAVPTQFGAGPPLGGADRPEPDTAGHAVFATNAPTGSKPHARTRWAVPGLGLLLVCALYGVKSLGERKQTVPEFAMAELPQDLPGAPSPPIPTPEPMQAQVDEFNDELPTFRLEELELVSSPLPNSAHSNEPFVFGHSEPTWRIPLRLELEAVSEVSQLDAREERTEELRLARKRARERRRARRRRAAARLRPIDESDPYVD